MTTLDLSNVNFPEKMDLRTAAIYLQMSEGYVRQRVTSGEIEAEKVEGQWIVTMKALDAFKAKPRRTGGGPRGNGKYWLVRIKHADLQKFKDLAEQCGTKIEPRYKSKTKSKDTKKRVPAQPQGNPAAK